MTSTLTIGTIAAVAHLVAAVWWYRNTRPPFRAFGTIILSGTAVIAGYITIRLWVES